jgi:hypothetical protein
MTMDAVKFQEEWVKRCEADYLVALCKAAITKGGFSDYGIKNIEKLMADRRDSIRAELEKEMEP